jgi:hypothetical protein
MRWVKHYYWQEAQLYFVCKETGHRPGSLRNRMWRKVQGARPFSNWELCSLILMLAQAQLPGDLKVCEVLNWQVTGTDFSSLSAGHLVHNVDTLFSLWSLCYLFLMLTSCGLKVNTVGWYGMTDPPKGFIFSRFRRDCRRGLYWGMGLLTS